MVGLVLLLVLEGSFIRMHGDLVVDQVEEISGRRWGIVSRSSRLVVMRGMVGIL